MSLSLVGIVLRGLAASQCWFNLSTSMGLATTYCDLILFGHNLTMTFWSYSVNAFPPVLKHDLRAAPQRVNFMAAMRSNRFYLLRSLPGAVSPVAILKRFSSSSLPPSFASGRFAAVSYSA
jgi:hypothetical protein